MSFLDGIIKAENGLTDRAKLDLGDNYMLSRDLLESMPFILSFSNDNDVSHIFDSQIIKDFYLAVLNIVRRHSLITNLILRHAIESIVLFAYSMEHKKEDEYVIKRNETDILDFKEKLLTEKAYKHMELKYPEYSKNLEGYKDTINVHYSHANIFSAQYNSAIIDGNLKLLIFDDYFDEHIRDTLCIINDIICITLRLYKILVYEYKSFVLIPDFDKKFEEYLIRHSKNLEDNIEKNKEKNLPKNELIDKIFMRLEKKYNIKDDIGKKKK